MKRRMAVGVCAMMLAAVVFVGAAETADQAKKPRPGRLTQPWNKIASLTDEQKTQIREIHGKATAEINAIREKETADIMALLTEEQRAEAQKLMEEQRTRRASVSSRDEEGGSTPAKVEERKNASE